jgi:hypothetical protein
MEHDPQHLNPGCERSTRPESVDFVGERALRLASSGQVPPCFPSRLLHHLVNGLLVGYTHFKLHRIFVLRTRRGSHEGVQEILGNLPPSNPADTRPNRQGTDSACPYVRLEVLKLFTFFDRLNRPRYPSKPITSFDTTKDGYPSLQSSSTLALSSKDKNFSFSSYAMRDAPSLLHSPTTPTDETYSPSTDDFPSTPSTTTTLAGSPRLSRSTRPLSLPSPVLPSSSRYIDFSRLSFVPPFLSNRS